MTTVPARFAQPRPAVAGPGQSPPWPGGWRSAATTDLGHLNAGPGGGQLDDP
ncbi:hypothetical protein ACIA8I_41270 [Streptomyces rishiriensis]|uniref:hypothetical protein n=1 Tax=Streptomyces rishiriensis TaxID=68264 RepID=UPI0037A4177F